jgi:hypothetical protein
MVNTIPRAPVVDGNMPWVGVVLILVWCGREARVDLCFVYDVVKGCPDFHLVQHVGRLR